MSTIPYTKGGPVDHHRPAPEFRRAMFLPYHHESLSLRMALFYELLAPGISSCGLSNLSSLIYDTGSTRLSEATINDAIELHNKTVTASGGWDSSGE